MITGLCGLVHILRRLVSRLPGMALCALVCAPVATHAQSIDKAQPGAILKIIHGWPDAPEQQDSLLTNLLRQRFGGVVCNVSFRDYLESPAAWNAFIRAVGRARQSGMDLWLYDESGYPSGTAGHLTLKDHPEWAAEGLLSTWEMSDGHELAITNPPGALILAAAFPWRAGGLVLEEKVDLAATVRAGHLNWKPQGPGTWLAMVITQCPLYEGTHAELNLAEKRAYPNLLSPEPTARFIEATHQQYAARLGTNLDFVSTFTDEPSLMSLFLRPMPYRPLPWSPAFAAEFSKRRGYAIEPLLPLLVVDGGAQTAKTRYDFWNTVGELVAENYFGQLLAWCREHQMHSGGHLLMEEGLTAQVGLYGNFFACARQMDAPGIDCLTSVPAEVPWQIARQAAGAADLNGNAEVMCETSDHSQRYRPAGDTRAVRRVSEAEIRGTCNSLMAHGVNRITSYYSFDGLDDQALGRVNRWVATVSNHMKGGCHAADIALLYPTESLWPRYVPSRLWATEAAEAQRVETSYHSAAQALHDHALDYTVIDSRGIIESTVDAQTLRHGGLGWKIVILPHADTLPSAAWTRLSDWVAHGGVCIALGALPANSESQFPSPAVQTLAREMFDESAPGLTIRTNAAGGAGIYVSPSQEWLLPRIIDGLIQPPISFSPGPASIQFTHRHFDGKDRIFIINDDSRGWSGTFSIPGARHLQRISLDQEQRTAIAQPESISMTLGAFDGLILETDPLPSAARKSWTGAGLPRLTASKMPSVEPVYGRGEFVRETFGADAEHAKAGVKAWSAHAAITKSQVDVFFFASFRYASPLNLTNAAAIQFDTWTPDGQRAGTQLLVIVHKKGGGDFLASTGRPLGSAGHEQIMAPPSAFQLAGWSSDPDGHMDWSRVEEIRIGWGGYLGAQGENVDFQFTEPQAVTLATP